MKNVRMMHLDNGLQLIAEDGVNDTIRNPFQVIIRPGENGQMSLSVMAYAP